MPRRQDISPAEIGAWRMAAQQIARHAFTAPGALVAWMGAVQAQDYAGARWAVGVRLAGRAIDERPLARALADGTVLRTHALRWTWQLVASADVRWLLALVAPRLISRAARRHRELGLDAAILRRSGATLARTLRDGGAATRAELRAALGAAGVATEDARLSHLLGRAELEGVICSGPPRGTEPTFALLDARVPSDRSPFTREQALAELARRYFRSHGPATLADFVWWSGLAPADARAGLAAAAPALARARLGESETWRDPALTRPSARALADAYLLPPFDEYLVGYRDRDTVLPRQHARRLNAGGGLLAPCIVLGGRVVGTWRRVLGRRADVTITLAPFEPPDRPARERIEAAAHHYGAFLDRTAAIVWARP
jgi:hypothetical protein